MEGGRGPKANETHEDYEALSHFKIPLYKR